MRRKLILVLALLLVVGVVVLVLTWANLGRIVKFGVEEGGSLVLGVPVKLKQATVVVSEGTVELNGLTIGSPKGFSAPYMFQLAHASATVDIGSLRSNTIVIKDVTIDKPQITLEFSNGTTNWGTVMERLKKPSPKESKKKMRIAHLEISGARVGIAGIPVAGEASAPLPAVDMTDVGGGEGQASSVRTVITEVVTRLYQAIFDAADKVVPTGQLQKMGTEALSKMEEEGKLPSGAAGKATEMLKGILGGEKKEK